MDNNLKVKEMVDFIIMLSHLDSNDVTEEVSHKDWFERIIKKAQEIRENIYDTEKSF